MKIHSFHSHLDFSPHNLETSEMSMAKGFTTKFLPCRNVTRRSI